MIVYDKVSTMQPAGGPENRNDFKWVSEVEFAFTLHPKYDSNLTNTSLLHLQFILLF